MCPFLCGRRRIVKKFECVKKSLFLSAFALAACFVAAAGFFSCDNMFDNGPNSGSQAAPAQTATTTTSNPTAPASNGQDIYVIVRGSVGVGNALPQEVSKNVQALDDSLAAGPGSALQEVAKSADPQLDVGKTAEYYYYVIATPQDSIGNTPVEYGREQNSLEVDDGIFKRGENGITYDLPLKIGKWKIECGIKNSSDEPVLRDITDVIELTADDSVVNKSFVAAPVDQTGKKGKIDLKIKKSANFSYVKPFCVALWGQDMDSTLLDYTGDDTSFGLVVPDVPAASYEMTLCFYNENDVMLYETVQTVNVFAGMTTNTWVCGGGEDDKLIKTVDGKIVFDVGTDALASYKRTAFYVSASGKDTNDGSRLSPLPSVQAAVNVIEATGSGDKDYTIYVSGTLTGKNVLFSSALGSSTSDTKKARSIVLSKPEGATEDSVIAGGLYSETDETYCNVLCVETSVPITVKGVKITRDPSLVAQGKKSRGILVSAEKANVTLLEGTEVFGNNAGDDTGGGGVYVLSGTLLIKGAKICNNHANDGGGIAMVDGGTVKMSSGEISENDGSCGGGISVLGGEFTMTGGAISKNTASDRGGAVYNQAKFEISGGAYIPYGDAAGNKGAGKNDVCLDYDNTNKVYKCMTVAGWLNPPAEAGSDKTVATITAFGWHRGQQILSAKSGVNLQQFAGADKKYFAFTDKDAFTTCKASAPTVAKLQAPLYVSPTGAEDNTGSKDSPYNSIATALSHFNDPEEDCVINIDGEVKGTNALGNGADGSSPVRCSKLVLQGANGLYAADTVVEGKTIAKGTPKDSLNGNKADNISVLYISTPVPVVIRNLKIFGGTGFSAGGITLGGGICQSNANVTLDSGTLIGDVLNPSAAATSVDDCGNKAQFGGGVCVSGGTLTVKSGAVISHNYATTTSYARGGGICVDTSGKLFIEDGAKIIGNASAKHGGAVYSEGQVTMTGGEISQNKADANGGAIYNNGTFEMSGKAWIPWGADKNNDVYLSSDKYITIASALSLPSGITSGANATITPQGWTRGKQVLEASSTIADEDAKKTLIANNCGRFATIDPEFDVEEEGTINAPLCVAALNATGAGARTAKDAEGKDWGAPSAETTARGTRSQPFAKMSQAAAQLSGRTSPYVIYINGKITGSDYACATFDGSNVADITIKGANKNNAVDVLDAASLEKGSSSKIIDLVFKGTSSNRISVKIQDLKITGANNLGKGYSDAGGGGISASYCDISLVKGVLIAGNKASYGGGVYADNSNLYVYSDACIGYKDAAGVAAGNDPTPTGEKPYGECSNYASSGGGGIYSIKSGVYLGYTSATTPAADDDKWTGGIYRNCSYDGGGIRIGNGSELKIAAGNISRNLATSEGGGIYIHDAGANSAVISGGKVEANQSNATGLYDGGGGICNLGSLVIKEDAEILGNKANQGGGVYNGSGTGSLSVLGGKIHDNTADASGGAVYQVAGTFSMGGTAWIPYGVKTTSGGTTTIEKGAGKNDVYLSSDKYITIDGTLSAPSGASGSNATIALENPSRNLKVLSGSATVANVGKFDLNAPGFKLDQMTESGSDYGVLSLKNIITDIYVSSSASATDPTGKTKDGSTWNNSTYAYNEYADNSAKPFATIQKALQFITWQQSASSYTIFIDGTLAGAQSIANNSDTDNPIRLANTASSSQPATATKIILSGINGLDPHDIPQDTIDRNLSGGTASDDGSALTINTAVPVEITDIGITGGNTTGSGGGINITGDTTDVTLKGYTSVYGNAAAESGGGINFDPGSTGTRRLYVQGNASVYLNTAKDGAGIYTGADASYLYLNEYAHIYGNTASANGGGIYHGGNFLFVNGNVVIGQSGVASTVAADAAASTGRNKAEKGGGIYQNAGLIWLGFKNNYNTYSGTDTWNGGINYNLATDSGGGIYTENATSNGVIMSGGAIAYNRACGTGDESGGGGIYSKKTIVLINDAMIGTATADGAPATTSTASNQATNGGGIYCTNYINLGQTSGSHTYTLNAGKGIVGNYASSRGGGVYTNSYTYMISGVIKSNATASVGGGIYNALNPLWLSGTVEISNNYAGSSGGAIWNKGGVKIQDNITMPYGVTTISGGTATTTKGNGKNDIYLMNYLYSGATTLYQITVTGNITIPTGGEIAVTPGAYERKVDAIKVSGTDSEASWHQGKFIVTDSDWHFTTYGSTDSKTSRLESEKIYVAAKDSTRATGLGAGSSSGKGSKSSPCLTIAGAAAQCWNPNTEYYIMVSGEVKNNAPEEVPASVTSSVAYKKLHIVGYTGSASDKINRNLTAEASNGSALIINTTFPVMIQNLAITGGNTSGDGGGINIAAAGTVQLYRCEITGNKAEHASPEGKGGGIYVCSGATLEFFTNSLNYSTVHGNSAKLGGGIYNEGKLDVQECHIYENTATGYGGGIYNNAGECYLGRRNSTSTSAAQVSSNTAQYGGGIYNKDGIVRIGYRLTSTSYALAAFKSDDYCVTQNKTSSDCTWGRGGGIYSYGNSSVLDIASGIIGGSDEEHGNQAQQFGGGIYVESSNDTATVTITGGSIQYNSAKDINGSGASYGAYDGKGGGIFLGDGILEMTGGSIKNNYAQLYGGGICVGEGSNATLKSQSNTVYANLVNNTAGSRGGAVYSEAKTTDGVVHQLTLGGYVRIMLPGTTAQTKENGVYLYKGAINIESVLSNHDTSLQSQIPLTFYSSNFNNGDVVLTGTTSQRTKFAITNSTLSINADGTLKKN